MGRFCRLKIFRCLTNTSLFPRIHPQCAAAMSVRGAAINIFSQDRELSKVGFMNNGVYINVAPKGQRGSRFATLLQALVVRDVTSRYRRSALGMWWAFLQPMILMLLFNMLRGFVNIPSDGLPYVLFSYAALVPWTFFTNAVAACGPSIITKRGSNKKDCPP